MKSLKFFLLLLFGGCMVVSARDKIIFWDYNKAVTFEMLQNLNLEEALSCLQVAVAINLDDIDVFFLDEQVFSMEKARFIANEYIDKLIQLQAKSDQGSIYFSFVINNKIVFNGLNRVMPLEATGHPLDFTNYPKMMMRYSTGADHVFFRITVALELMWHSIWDVSQAEYDANTLTCIEINNYFSSQNKVRRGRYDILLLYRSGIMLLRSEN
jgi:hypothetical protein